MEHETCKRVLKKSIQRSGVTDFMIRMMQVIIDVERSEVSSRQKRIPAPHKKRAHLETWVTWNSGLGFRHKVGRCKGWLSECVKTEELRPPTAM